MTTLKVEPIAKGDNDEYETIIEYLIKKVTECEESMDDVLTLCRRVLGYTKQYMKPLIIEQKVKETHIEFTVCVDTFSRLLDQYFFYFNKNVKILIPGVGYVSFIVSVDIYTYILTFCCDKYIYTHKKVK